ncbi:hypothetical protein EPT55_10375, partial [Fusobacterium necrophorum]|uniref:hypothetical protein n=1 Tax=Fusobacterium necrophorum TaxID=859 RepID=UPI001027C940
LLRNLLLELVRQIPSQNPLAAMEVKFYNGWGKREYQKIQSWKTGKDIYDYFEQHIEIQKWKEEEYPDVLDVFYEVLSRLYA